MGIKEYFSNTEPGTFNPTDFTNQITGILLVFGYVCAVVMIFYIAIRYMFAKPSEKAQLKSRLAYLLGGVILLISATTILGVVGGLFAGIFNAPGW